jgi:hypothetical protein
MLDFALKKDPMLELHTHIPATSALQQSPPWGQQGVRNQRCQRKKIQEGSNGEKDSNRMYGTLSRPNHRLQQREKERLLPSCHCQYKPLES